MVPITKNEATGKWKVPDAKEFVQNTGWRDGKWVVAETIEGVVAYESYATACKEALCLFELIRAARELEAKFL
jgi:hypothetical protein